MVSANADAFSAVNAQFISDHGLAVVDPDRLGRTVFDAVCAPLAQFFLEQHRVFFHTNHSHRLSGRAGLQVNNSSKLALFSLSCLHRKLI